MAGHNALIALALLAGVAGTFGGLTDRDSTQLVDESATPGLVEKPPYFTDTSVKRLSVSEGDALSIDCRPGGTPNPSVEWERLGDVLPYYGGNLYKHQKLDIPMLTRGDGGHFICRADNGVGKSAESHIILEVQHAPIVTFSEDVLYRGVGNGAKLECHVEAMPAAEVAWFKDDVKLEESPKTKITQREDRENRQFVSTLSFKDVEKEDFGLYRCVAENLKGKSEETSTLTRKTPPVITTQSENEIVYSIEKQKARNALPIVIECGAEGAPRPEYRWTKDNIPLIVENNPELSMEPETGNLLIDQPTVNHNGRYQCIAHNEYGTAVSDPVTLVNNTDIYFSNSKGSFDVEAELGRPFKLSCPEATGYPKPQLTWMKSYSPPESGDVKLEIFNNERVVVDPEGNLWFTHITEEDDTSKNDFQLMCLANNEFAPQDYSLGVLINLKVIKPDDSVDNLRDDTINVQPIPLYTSARILNFNGDGENAIWCIFGGEPNPKITWKRIDDKEIDETRFVTRNNGKTLISKNTTMDDAGEYACIAGNGIGEEQVKYFSVNVRMAPKMITELKSYTADIGATISFECTAESSEEVKYKWFFNGYPLGMDTPIVTFSDIRISHTGNYACNASNSLGHTFNQAFLLVNENSEASGSCSEVSALREEIISLKGVIHELKDLVIDQHKTVESNHQMLHKLIMGSEQEEESMDMQEVTTMIPDVLTSAA